ncbi:MAG TPA: tetratricopeptide repeat protein [Drouetiella sp.]|jgi:tetratricopeptide (TPR) repeat protein
MNKAASKRVNSLLLAITIGLTTALATNAGSTGAAFARTSNTGNTFCSSSEPWSTVAQPTATSNTQLKEFAARKANQSDALDETYRKNGDMKLSDGDFTGALDEYDKALQVNPRNAMAYYGRGRVRLATSNYTEARVDLNKALNIDSNLTSARLALIGILMYTRDFASGVSEATKVIESDPQNALAYYERGICNGEVGRRAEAVSDLNQAKSLLSSSGDQVGCDFVNYSLGKQYQENGRYAAYQKDFTTALNDFDLALNINSNSAATLIAKASVEREMGSNEAALADYNKAVEVAPLLPDAYKERGNFYYQSASYQLAQDDFTRALAISPADADLYNCRARTYEALGNIVSANADYRQAELVAKSHARQDAEQLTKEVTELVQKV